MKLLLCLLGLLLWSIGIFHYLEGEKDRWSLIELNVMLAVSFCCILTGVL